MKRRAVKYLANADSDLLAIAEYVLDRSRNLATARAYIDRLHARCERIGDAPFGGVARNDLGAGIRMTVFERRIVILYRVDDAAVWITNIFSGGRDFDALLARSRTIAPDDPD